MRKSIKKIISVFAVCGLMVTGINVSAEESTKSNTFTDNVLTYEKTGAYTAKIISCTDQTVSVDIPDEIDGYRVTAVAEKAFAECENLREVSLPDSVTDMGESAFYGCTALEKVKFTGGVNEVPQNTFFYCTSLKDVELPESVKTIDNYAFAYCIALDEFELPSTVETINTAAFYCSQLSDDFVIPEGVKTIGSTAFYSCAGMKTVSLPKSLTNMESYAFFACDELSEFRTAEGCKYNAIDGILYNSDKNVILLCPSGKAVENFTVPEKVKKIGDGAFFANTSLKTIDLGNVTYIGEGAFSNCTALEKLEFPSTIKEIPSNGFTDCESLWSVTIPDSVTEIGEYAFYNCKRLKSIELPNSVTDVGVYALGFYEDDENNKVKMDDFKITGGENAKFANGFRVNDGVANTYLAFLLYIGLPLLIISPIVIFFLVKFTRGDKGCEDETDDEDESDEDDNDDEEDNEEEE